MSVTRIRIAALRRLEKRAGELEHPTAQAVADGLHVQTGNLGAAGDGRTPPRLVARMPQGLAAKGVGQDLGAHVGAQDRHEVIGVVRALTEALELDAQAVRRVAGPRRQLVRGKGIERLRGGTAHAGVVASSHHRPDAACRTGISTASQRPEFGRAGRTRQARGTIAAAELRATRTLSTG